MNNTPHAEIIRIHTSQQEFFATRATYDIKFRKAMLKKLYAALIKWEKPLCEALYQDLHKSYEEAFLTEISIVLGEIKKHIKHVSSWSKKRYVNTPLKLFPSSTYLVQEPLGNSLIIAPWNYPVQLLLNPLVGAISAGCTAILKPSPYVENVSTVLEKMIKETFDESYIAVVQGNREVNSQLLDLKFDTIFFTGSPSLGRTVMTAAAKYLTPVVLELGGKSPCIIDETADIELAARRISWGKTLNSGQTCIAPDYVLIHKSLTEEFVKRFKTNLTKMHGENVQNSSHYVRMINTKEFNRVSSYLKDGEILLGGKTDEQERFIEPTLLKVTNLDSPVMNNEIFGPVLPIIEFEDKKEALELVNKRPKPLAFYYFGEKKNGWEAIRKCTSGGACLNDTIMHIANENSPFGGVGNSGLGCYHGKDSFTAFSHKRTVLYTPTWLDVPFRYMPYSLFKYIKFLL
ncbi:MAG: aldehyde dehydrogenase [Paludibacteraceae bacterium]|nr:aldehyde dehydrogenase [Paludibacteraceae bacterium]